MKKIILGVDPSIRKSGIAVFSKDLGQPKIIHYQTIEPKKAEDRFRFIAKAAEEIIVQYKPDVMAIETQFMARNAKTALDLSMVRGVFRGVFYTFRDKGVVVDITPKGAKCMVGVTDNRLSGKDSKIAVQKMVKLMYPELRKEGIAPDVYDAVAIALAGLGKLMYK